MFGAGYVAAEDRLFFIDALRHAGRAQLSSFAGGSAGNGEMDRSVWADTPYPTSRSCRSSTTSPTRSTAPTGAQVQRDVDELRRRHQQVHRRDPRQPAADAGRVRAARPSRRPRGLEGHRRDLDRLAGRRDLRQGRRQRGRLGAGARGGAEAVRQARRQDGLGRLPPRQRPRGADHGPRARASPTCRVAAGAQRPALPDPGTTVRRRRSSPRRAPSAETQSGATPAASCPTSATCSAACARCRASSNALLVSEQESKGGAPSPSSGPRSPTSRRRS